MNLLPRHTKTATCTHDKISNAPAFNTISRCDVLLLHHSACTLLYCNLDKNISMFFAIIQLLYYVNTLVKKRL